MINKILNILLLISIMLTCGCSNEKQNTSDIKEDGSTPNQQEEINENKVSEFLDKMNCNIILTGEVGSSIQKKMSKKCQIIEDYNEVYNIALKNDKNLLFIYRSDYRKLKQR